MRVAVTIFSAGGLVVLAAHGCAAGPPRGGPPPRTDFAIPPLDAGIVVRASTPGGVRFDHPPARAGAAWSVAVRATSRAEDPRGGEQVSAYESDHRVEILAIDGPAPSRLRVRFTRNVHVFQGHATPTAIDGKEYVVDARAPHVRDAVGAAAPEPEAQRVLDVLPDLGTRTRLDEVLPDEAMRLGERRDEVAAAILRVIHPRAWTLRSGEARLVEASGDDARFTVTLDAASDTGLRMWLAGDALVRTRDARLSRLALEGRYEQTAAGSSDPPGTMTLSRVVTDEPAPAGGR